MATSRYYAKNVIYFNLTQGIFVKFVPDGHLCSLALGCLTRGRKLVEEIAPNSHLNKSVGFVKFEDRSTRHSRRNHHHCQFMPDFTHEQSAERFGDRRQRHKR